MDLNREKVIKLVIVVLATLAALAVMSTLVQLIQTILPFLIVGGGIYIGYRWALSDAPAPTADEVEEQARGLFSRFRRSKKAVETTMKVGEALNDMAGSSERKARRRQKTSKVDRSEASGKSEIVPEAPPAEDSPQTEETEEREEKVSQMKGALESNPAGAIEFNDQDVVISADDVVQPDISRLKEKEKEVPKVTNNVLAQIEERRRRLESGD